MIKAWHLGGVQVKPQGCKLEAKDMVLDRDCHGTSALSSFANDFELACSHSRQIPFVVQDAISLRHADVPLVALPAD